MEIDKRTKPFITPEEAYQAIEHYQEAREKSSPYVSEVKVRFRQGEVSRSIHIGDDHFGHQDSDSRALERSVNEAENDGIVVSHMNIIESTSPKFTDTNAVNVTFITQDQKRIVRQITSPLDRQGRFVFASRNMCHEGWGSRFGFQDPIVDIAEPNTPILNVGGQVKFTDESTGEVGGVLEVYHDPGMGVTKQSPEGGLRVHSREVPDGHVDKADALGQGHLHKLFAVQDVRHNPVTDSDSITTLFGVGTAKGFKDNPDGYLLGRHSVPPRNQPADAGKGITLIWKQDRSNPNKLRPYPVAHYPRARVIYNASKTFEQAEKSGITKELEEKVLESVVGQKPKVIYDAQKSKVYQPSPTGEFVGNTPLHTKTHHTIESNLPVAFSFIGGLRQGSSTFREQRLQEVLGDIDSNPFAFWFATRRLVDQWTSKNENRGQILTQLASNLGIAKDKLLSIMATDEFLIPKWNADIKQGKQILSPAINPADFLFDKLKKPLTKPQFISELSFKTTDLPDNKQVDYTFFQTDRLRRFTSVINPFHGLTRIHENSGAAADLYVGGHTEEGGWRTWMLPNGHQLETVIPGGFSGFIEKGRHNEMEYFEGGQGVVVFPDRKAIYSFASHDDLMDYHRALVLHEGLKHLNINI